MKLTDYIKEYHKGSVKSFANTNDIKHRQQIEQMIARGNYHIVEVDELMRLIQVKREIKNIKG